MSSVYLQVRGRRAAQEVWEDYARPENWPAWSPQIRSVEATADRIAAGVTGTVPVLPGLRLTFRVLDVDEDARRWSWRVWLGPVSLLLHHGVIDVPRGTLTWLRMEGPDLVVRGYAPLARFALRRLVAGPPRLSS